MYNEKIIYKIYKAHHHYKTVKAKPFSHNNLLLSTVRLISSRLIGPSRPLFRYLLSSMMLVMNSLSISTFYCLLPFRRLSYLSTVESSPSLLPFSKSIFQQFLSHIYDESSFLVINNSTTNNCFANAFLA